MEERDVIIIGAGPAGLAAAVFTQLDGWKTLLLEGSWVGGQAAIAGRVGNYPGFLPGDGALLVENMVKQVVLAPPAGVGAELRCEKVTDIDAEKRMVITRNNQYRAQVIILATGSTMQRLGVPGEDTFIGKGVSYYAKRDLNQFAGKKILVVGGGNTTAKSALLTKTLASEVILIHRRDALRTYPVLTKKLVKEGVQVRYNTELKELTGNGHVEVAVLLNNKTQKKSRLAIDWVVICVGTEPDPRLAQRAGLEIVGKHVTVNPKMMTSRVGIFACGEITGGKRHLITAAAEGASAGMNVSEYLALEMLKRNDTFKGAKNGKYADEYLAMLR